MLVRFCSASYLDPLLLLLGHNEVPLLLHHLGVVVNDDRYQQVDPEEGTQEYKDDDVQPCSRLGVHLQRAYVQGCAWAEILGFFTKAKFAKHCGPLLRPAQRMTSDLCYPSIGPGFAMQPAGTSRHAFKKLKNVRNKLVPDNTRKPTCIANPYTL